jgi:hypothetical protein
MRWALPWSWGRSLGGCLQAHPTTSGEAAVIGTAEVMVGNQSTSSVHAGVQRDPPIQLTWCGNTPLVHVTYA